MGWHETGGNASRVAEDGEKGEWGKAVDREEAEYVVLPLAKVMRSLLENPDCQRIYSGSSMSPVSAIDAMFGRWNIRFGKVIGLLGPVDAETRGMDNLPRISLSPLGLYTQNIETKINTESWLAASEREQLLLLMHELGHAISFMGVGTITGGFVHQDRNPSVNFNNDQLIKTNCMKGYW
jgi:hypothetical protein